MDALHQRISKRPQLLIATVVLATCTSLLTGLATAQAHFQTADVFAIPPGNPLDLTGAAWFKRTESRIQGRLSPLSCIC